MQRSHLEEQPREAEQGLIWNGILCFGPQGEHQLLPGPRGSWACFLSGGMVRAPCPRLLNQADVIYKHLDRI